jgi:hypothetical protein
MRFSFLCSSKKRLVDVPGVAGVTGVTGVTEINGYEFDLRIGYKI